MILVFNFCPCWTEFPCKYPSLPMNPQTPGPYLYNPHGYYGYPPYQWPPAPFSNIPTSAPTNPATTCSPWTTQSSNHPPSLPLMNGFPNSSYPLPTISPPSQYADVNGFSNHFHPSTSYQISPPYQMSPPPPPSPTPPPPPPPPYTSCPSSAASSAPPSPTHSNVEPLTKHSYPYPYPYYPYGYPALINHFVTYEPPPPLDYIPKYVDCQWKDNICKFLQLPFKPYANVNNCPVRKGGLQGTVYTMGSDGNCFFRCISQELTGEQTYHDKLRSKVCTFMEQHRDKFEAYVDTSFSKHIRKMKRDGTWATHAEIFGMATLLGCSIHVHTKYGCKTEWLQHNPLFQHHTPLPGYENLKAHGQIFVLHAGQIHFNLFVIWAEHF